MAGACPADVSGGISGVLRSQPGARRSLAGDSGEGGDTFCHGLPRVRVCVVLETQFLSSALHHSCQESTAGGVRLPSRRPGSAGSQIA